VKSNTKIYLIYALILYLAYVIGSVVGKYIDLIKEWQTLAAGAMALGGALITVAVLISQHTFDKKKDREEKKKNALYMRSLIPDSLSELIFYSEKCFKYIQDNGDQIPNKPSSAIDTLKENIKFADVDTSKNLFEIVSFYQVHNARINSYKKNNATNKEENILYDICLLHHYFNKLFSYARDEVQSVKEIFPTKNDMEYSVKNLIGRDHYYDNPKKYDDLFSKMESHRKAAEK